MRVPMMQVLRLLVLMAGLLVLDAAFAAAGKMLFVSGSVSIERGTVKPAAVGDPLEVGDVIVTGEKSRAQILMGDGAKFALRAASRLRIDGFALPPGVTAPQASTTAADGLFAASLLKGGFRTMSGAIGKVDKSAYEVRTPIGTLGIRGTDYWALFCRGDCAQVPGVIPGQPVRDGLYLGVNDGSIVFRNGKIEIVLKMHEYIFIPLADGNPEPLQTAPLFLLDDATGPLQVHRGEAGTRGALAVELTGFNDRRDPPPGSTGDANNPKTAARPSDTSPPLTVGAADATGQPVDLTSGQLPPALQRNLAWSNGSLGLGVAAATVPTYILDATNNVVGFDSTIPPRQGPARAATFAIGSATNSDTGLDAATGLAWGRWSNGTSTYTPAGGVQTNLPLVNESLHWIVDSPFTPTPVLPTTGIATFALVGNTSPTDTLANIGNLGAASLTADFANGTVTSAISLDMAGVSWYAVGNGAIGNGTVQFAGPYTQGVIGGTVPVAGSFDGFFSVPAAGGPATLGGAVSYDLAESQGLLGTVSGVLAFAENPQGSVVTQPAAQGRDVSYTLGNFSQSQTFSDVQANTAADYAVDTGLNLTRYLGTFNAGNGPFPAQYDQGTAATGESGVDSLSLIRWGRWSGGTATVDAGSGPTPIDLTQKSLHWVMSGDANNPPSLPAGGVANYTLIGNTTPTDAAGATGVLGSATLTANFGQQTVQSTLNVQMPAGSWAANGNGLIGAGAGVAPHQFVGGYAGNFTPTVGSSIGATGSFAGFFAGRPVGPGLVPAGAGMTFSLLDDAGVNNVTGAVVLRGN